MQDLLVVPVGAASFAEAIEWAARVRAATARSRPSGASGRASSPTRAGSARRSRPPEPRSSCSRAGSSAAGSAPGEDVAIAVDVAATQLFAGHGGYRLAERGRELDAERARRADRGWRARAIPIVSIEDPLADDDWSGWTHRDRAARDGLQSLGDDLFVTDPERLERAIAEESRTRCSSSRTRSARSAMPRASCATRRRPATPPCVSARSGDTEDGWLADLAVGWRAGQIKVGSTMRSERTAKWNRLLEIEALDPSRRVRRCGALALHVASPRLPSDRVCSRPLRPIPDGPAAPRFGDDRRRQLPVRTPRRWRLRAARRRHRSRAQRAPLRALGAPGRRVARSALRRGAGHRRRVRPLPAERARRPLRARGRRAARERRRLPVLLLGVGARARAGCRGGCRSPVPLQRPLRVARRPTRRLAGPRRESRSPCVCAPRRARSRSRTPRAGRW